MYESPSTTVGDDAGGVVGVLDEACPAMPEWEPPVEADELADRAPGADLAWLLEIADLDGADDHAVVEAVAAWQRMASWAAAGAARAAAVLADRASMNPAWPQSAGKVARPCVAGEELALRLGCSRRQAASLVRHGRAFAGALAWTGDALARGDIDPAKARVLVDALDPVPVPVALAVQDAVLDGAPTRTPTQLSRDVARALITVDPAGAAERHAAGARGRRVDAPRVLPNGMAGIWAVLPAGGAARLDASLTALARAGRTAGDPRTLDQLRADLLVDLTTGATTGATGTTAPGGVGGTTGDPSTATTTADGPTHPTRPTHRTEIRVTVALGTLLGLDDDPATLAGYGPITAEAARALAAGGVWRRIVTDPLTGAVLDVGRTRYRPPADLDTHVRVRDATCARPGCPTPAETCDLDHTVEYHRAHGPTAHTNLGPLCRRDHTVKTDGGFHLTQTAPGTFEWTTPTGHRYTIRPGLDQPYQRLPRASTHQPSTDPPPPF